MTDNQITDNKRFCLAWKIMLMQFIIQQIVMTKDFNWTQAFDVCCSIAALGLGLCITLPPNPTGAASKSHTVVWQGSHKIKTTRQECDVSVV